MWEVRSVLQPKPGQLDGVHFPILFSSPSTSARGAFCCDIFSIDNLLIIGAKTSRPLVTQAGIEKVI
jgi:hypothetical protein